MSDWKNMTQHDGYQKWRHLEFKRLNGLVQRGLNRFMNPRNCSEVKYLSCLNDITCGYGRIGFFQIP